MEQHRQFLNAIRRGNAEMVQDMIEHGVDINKPDSSGQTPLMEAVIENKWLVVVRLLNAHTNIEVSDNSGDTALDIARELRGVYTTERENEDMDDIVRYLEDAQSQLNTLKMLALAQHESKRVYQPNRGDTMEENLARLLFQKAPSDVSRAVFKNLGKRMKGLKW